MNDPTETHALSLDFNLPHPPAKVWRALTEPKLLSAWLMNTDLAGPPAVGKAFKFTLPPTAWWDGVVKCEVLEADQPKRLKYTWRGGPGSSPLDTVVTWTLTPTPSGGTRLSLEHSGFTRGNKFAFDGALKGWERNVGQMQDVLERALDNQ